MRQALVKILAKEQDRLNIAHYQREPCRLDLYEVAEWPSCANRQPIQHFSVEVLFLEGHPIKPFYQAMRLYAMTSISVISPNSPCSVFAS